MPVLRIMVVAAVVIALCASCSGSGNTDYLVDTGALPELASLQGKAASGFLVDTASVFDASPGYIPEADNTPGLGELSWVIYSAAPFHIPLPPKEIELNLVGSSGEVWLAVGNYTSNAWDFYQVNAPYMDKMPVILRDGPRYYRGDAQTFVALVAAYGSTLQCNGITVLPTKGQIYFGDYTIANQTDMDAIADYQGIDGSLYFAAPALTDMAGLANLEFVTGNFTTASVVGLVSMANLTSLRTVMGTFDVRQCLNLIEISCPNYEWHGGWLWIEDNPKLEAVNFPIIWSLTSLDFSYNNMVASLEFPELREIRGHMLVNHNENLQSFICPNLQWAVDYVDIQDDPILSTLSLPMFDYIGGDLTLSFLPQLTDVAGLAALEDTGGLFIIATGLTHLDDLVSLKHVSVSSSNLYISENTVLGSISRLAGLLPDPDHGFIVDGNLTITNNALSNGDQDAYDLVAAWGGTASVSGSITVSGN